MAASLGWRVKFLVGLVCTLLGLMALSHEATALSADDFIPPVQATSPAQKEELSTIKDQDSVRTENDPVLKTEITTAPTLQDAINKTIEKPKQGCRILSEPGGGYAFVATGVAGYDINHQNITASRIEQRNAYIQAFMNAKSQMAQTIGEVVVRGATNFDKKIETLDEKDKQLRNIESELSEEQLQSVRKVLKGFVTYSVQDNGKGRVFVTIVSSSKTRGKYNRNGTDGVAADSLKDGLNSLIAEIKNGFVPPVGGRIIEVPETGEIAFVGFGSSVVRYDPEEDAQEDLKLQAERVAGLRATDALAGIILGDDTTWQAHADESTSKQIKDFERLQKSDQSAQGSAAEIQAFEQRKRDLRNSLKEDTNIRSLRSGVLPPAIMRETSLDDDEYFAYGIAVYIPSLSDAVRKVSKEMDDAQLVNPVESKTSSVPTPKLEMKKGPSGVVKQDL